jgi:hypothetical protein
MAGYSMADALRYGAHQEVSVAAMMGQCITSGYSKKMVIILIGGGVITTSHESLDFYLPLQSLSRRGIEMERFVCAALPDIDQRHLKRGMCPWCCAPLYDTGELDKCSECGDEFVGPLNVED